MARSIDKAGQACAKEITPEMLRAAVIIYNEWQPRHIFDADGAPPYAAEELVVSILRLALPEAALPGFSVAYDLEETVLETCGERKSL